ncbi:hypothetical protein ACFVGN_42845, partial [Streptomyces sp. NPDC057757]|uniref:hypothetical protein n=1 Tax=Streptomyces sp. NPDC057757 TaxID=3346241 RepID=UPI0036A48A7E
CGVIKIYSADALGVHPVFPFRAFGASTAVTRAESERASVPHSHVSIQTRMTGVVALCEKCA